MCGHSIISPTTTPSRSSPRSFASRATESSTSELECAVDERLRRNETEFRLAEKPFKRDLEQSRKQLLELDAGYQLNSNGRFDGRDDYLRLNNTELSAADVAQHIIEHFSLPTT